jgi:polyferredoxin
MVASRLADAVLIVHVLFVLFVVGGFALILVGAGRWAWVHDRAFRIAHLAAIVFVAAEALLGVTCPLTHWEDILRAAGREERSFIGRWLAWLLYYDLPEWVFALVYAAFALAVIGCWRAVPPRARSTRSE